MQIFIAMNYLILSQRSTFVLEKDRRSDWICVLRKNLMNYVYLKDINKNREKKEKKTKDTNCSKTRTEHYYYATTGF